MVGIKEIVAMMVQVLVGAPGAGKTTRLLTEVGKRRGRYVVSIPGLHLNTEFVTRIVQAAQDAGIATPKIVEIHSGSAWDQPGNQAMPSQTRVNHALEAAADVYRAEYHVVVVCSHEGLMASDMSRYAGWELILDEAPTSLSSGQFSVPVTSTFFQEVYDLQPVDARHARAVPKRGARVDHQLLDADAFLRDLALFHRRAISPLGCVVNVHDWREAASPGRVVQWFSLWTPHDVRAFDRVTISAASYFHSVGYQAAALVDGDAVNYEQILVSGAGARSPRKVIIRYFTSQHSGSTSWWTDRTGPGRDCLFKVGRWLAAHASPNQFWSCNTVLEPMLAAIGMPGAYLPPRIAGTNAWRDRCECTMIYSGKASSQDAPLLGIFGLSTQAIMRSREVEDIGQFATRGAIRSQQWSGTYTANVYSLDQAEALKSFLVGNSLASTPEIELLYGDAGIGGIVRSGREWSAPADNIGINPDLDAERRRETERLRSQRRRDDAKTKAKADGRYQRPGRPSHRS